MTYFELQGTLDFTCAEKTIVVSLPDFSLLLYIIFALNRQKWIAKHTFNFVQHRYVQSTAGSLSLIIIITLI